MYTEALIFSASKVTGGSKTPFLIGSRNESYNVVYGYFLEVCERSGLKVALTSSADIVGPGTCRSFWSFKNKEWFRIDKVCRSDLIFDKFSPTRKGIKSRRELLFSSDKVKSFNDPDLFDLFFDKQRTYEGLFEHAIPAVTLDDRTIEGVNQSCRMLLELVASHPNSTDFSQEIVMKDRFGAGGRHIYKFKKEQEKEMVSVMRKNTKISFIIQPFAKFDQGFRYRNLPASTDIRFIYLNSKIVQSYIRVAKANDFRCNEHQGGSLTYLSLKEIPKDLVTKADSIAERLNKNNSLYALDFIVSNSGNTYLLEGNTGPGLDWNMSLKKNEAEAKKLIRLVVRELTVRAEKHQVFPKSL